MAHIQEMAHTLLLVSTQDTSGWSLDPSSPQIFPFENSPPNHQPAKDGHFWPWVGGPHLLPDIIFLRLLPYFDVVSLFNTKHALLVIAPSESIGPFLDSDVSSAKLLPHGFDVSFRDLV